MPQTKKNTKNSGKPAAKKTEPAAKKTKSASKPIEPAKKEHPFLTQAAPYLMAVVAVLLAVSVILGEGKIGGGIRTLLTGLFGGGAYALPVLLLVRTLFWKRDNEEGQTRGRTVCTAIVFVLLTMLLHVLGGGEAAFSPVTHFQDGQVLVGGGAVGGILGELLLRGFGKVCTLIILFSAIVLLGLYVAGLTLRGVYVYLAYQIRFASEKRAERKAEEAERRRNAPPSRNQIREEEYLEYLRQKKQKRMAESDEETAESPAVRTTATKTGAKKSPAGEQIPMGTPAPTVYRVKRRRMTDLDIPVDDITLPDEDDEDLTEMDPAEEDRAQVEAALSDTAVDQDAVDEKIFDEVMRRTRERIEKSQQAETLRGAARREENSEPMAATVTPIGEEPVREPISEPDETDDFFEGDGNEEEIVAGDVLDAVEVAAIGLREQSRVARSAPSDDETDTVKLASSVGGEEGELDLSGFFVNPEDAELLNKLSEQYRQPLDVKRESVSAPLPKIQKPVAPAAPPYQFPPIDLLEKDPGNGGENIKEELQENAVKLVETLKSFNVKTKIENISRGPTITRYELLPEPGTRVRSIVNLVDDIALNLATTGVRIEAPIPGKSAVGIEVPNKNRTTVHLRTLIENKAFVEAKSKLTVCLGEDVAGEAVYFDIAKMPHLLIAGATGAGKSVCINSIITSLLYKASPEDVKMILIDPKKVELNIYNGIPHLLVPVVSEPKKAAGSLSWAVSEMERRYGLIEAVGVRNIRSFNEVTKDDPDYEYMPRIVIIIDELADLMMTAPDDVEDSICRIAQKARAAGMHLIIGTQRPSVDVITGLIKANIPSRIAFRTSSQIDSRTIIDVGSAANLIGMGDMLFAPVGAMKPARVQGAYVDEANVEEVVSYIQNINAACGSYSEEVANQIEREAQRCGVSGKKGAVMEEDGGEEEDSMLKSAVELAIDSGKISTSLIQRRLSLGYGRAAKLIDRMEQLGYVSAPDGQKPRDVLITRQEFMEMRLRDEAPFDV